ncbi:MAG: hypothetical protein JXA82_19055 [Sedimentisphaerales bacterium]|nr:hypothetical protein [Sedimentisphaerales bacterium]
MTRKISILMFCTIWLCTRFSTTVLADISNPQTGWKPDKFIITFWCPPPATDGALSRVAAEHYNLTWVPVEGLDVATRHGLRAMLTNSLLQPSTLDNVAKRAQLDALIDRVKVHPALEAYYICDEPGAAAFPGLGRLVAYLKERDPKHLAYINLFPTYANEQQLGVTAAAAELGRVGYPTNLAGVEPDNKVVLAYQEHLQQYLEIVKPDLISYDHYHFFRNGDGPQYFLNLALIRMAAIESGKPFLNIIQASTLEKVWRLPTANEIRWLVFTTMAYGGRGISYFTYWGPESYGGLYQDGESSPLAADVAAINAEIEKFGPTLMTLDSMGVYHTKPLPLGTEPVPTEAPVQILSNGEFVLGLFGQKERISAFMIVNRSYISNVEATLKVTLPIDSLQELDRTSGKWGNSLTLGENHTITITLQPGNGRLFRASK